MACIVGMGSLCLSPRRNISNNSHLRWSAARQVSIARASGSRVADDVAKKLSVSSSRTSPLWLMLPPKYPDINRFYSLEEKRVIPLIIYASHEIMDDQPLCIGSSHGWLVYTNYSSDCALFLYNPNPNSSEIIKLPSIETLPVHDEIKPREQPSYLFIEKLILSSSPSPNKEGEENGCIAMCIYGAGRNLAFCRPGHDTAWFPLDEDSCYKEIVYSSRDKLFYCFNDFYKQQLHCWDLGDPLSPKRKLVVDLVKEEEEEEYEKEHHHETYLIADPCDDDFLIVERFLFAHKTLFFKVYKLDFNNGVMKYLKHSLNDRVLFVGINHSFSLPAHDFPYLRPNSIYFTDAATWNMHGGHGHDMGIFNYQDKVFESCYHPCYLKSSSIRRMLPPLVWFTPNWRRPRCV